MIVGLSGKDKELAFVVDNGGARGWVKLAPIADPLLLATPCAWIKACEQKLIFDFRRLLCRSNVFWAENGDGRTRYLKQYVGSLYSGYNLWISHTATLRRSNGQYPGHYCSVVPSLTIRYIGTRCYVAPIDWLIQILSYYPNYIRRNTNEYCKAI